MNLYEISIAYVKLVYMLIKKIYIMIELYKYNIFYYLFNRDIEDKVIKLHKNIIINKVMSNYDILSLIYLDENDVLLDIAHYF